MNVRDLRDRLDGLDDETEVRLMTQDSWPFEYSVLGTWEPVPQPDTCGECGLTEADHQITPDPDFVHAFEPYDAFTPAGSPESGVIYLVEGTQLAYGTKVAWEEVER